MQKRELIPLEQRVDESIFNLVKEASNLYSTNIAFNFRNSYKDPLVKKTFASCETDYQALMLALIKKLVEEKIDLSSLYISLIGDNSYAWVIAYLSIVCGLGVCVPLDKQLPSLEVVRLTKRSRAKILFFSPSQTEKILDLASQTSDVRFFVCLDFFPSKKEKLIDFSDTRFLRLSSLLQVGEEILANEEEKELLFNKIKIPRSEDVALLLFTSGTTNTSKGVLLTHRNICTNIAMIKSVLTLTSEDRMLSVLPLHHTFENTAGFLFPFVSGTSIFFTDGLRYLAHNLKEWEITAMIGVPLLFENIYKRINEKIKTSSLKSTSFALLKTMSKGFNTIGLDMNRLLFRSVLRAFGGKIRLLVSGASAISPEVMQAFRDFGIDFRQGYGMTETSPVMTLNEAPSLKSSDYSVGLPLPGVEIAIDTNETYIGAIGEILTRSDAVMSSYFEDEEATSAVFTSEGYLRTGDLGFLDQRGRLHITGRCKDMIVLESGKKVFPEEVEAVLQTSPFVDEVFVYGYTSEQEVSLTSLLRLNKEEVHNFLTVFASEHQEFDSADLCDKWDRNLVLPEEVWDALYQEVLNSIQNISKQLTAYKKIRFVLITREEFIKTTTLKLKRKLQQERLEAFFRSHTLPLHKLQKKELR